MKRHILYLSYLYILRCQMFSLFFFHFSLAYYKKYTPVSRRHVLISLWVFNVSGFPSLIVCGAIRKSFFFKRHLRDLTGASQGWLYHALVTLNIVFLTASYRSD